MRDFFPGPCSVPLVSRSVLNPAPRSPNCCSFVVSSQLGSVSPPNLSSPRLFGPGRYLSGLEHHPDTPRLRVRSPVRARTRINKRVHESAEQQIDVSPSLSHSLSPFPSFLPLKSTNKNFKQLKKALFWPSGTPCSFIAI